MIVHCVDVIVKVKGLARLSLSRPFTQRAFIRTVSGIYKTKLYYACLDKSSNKSRAKVDSMSPH